MALGLQLTQPEIGWTRYNYNFERITVSSEWSIRNGDDILSYNNNDISTNSIEQTIKFRFFGNGIRIIAPVNDNLSTLVNIKIGDYIDENYSLNNSSLAWQSIVYEKENLYPNLYTVVITTKTNDLNIFDCIDIKNGHICETDKCELEHIYNDVVSNKNIKLDYILPMNTTKNIKSKENDERVGLLGMANDDENFGDLYVVGKDGKAHLTKNGSKYEIIFDGKANKTGDYILLKSIKEFKMLMICFSLDNNTTKENTLKGTHLIPLVDIDFGETLQHIRAHRIVFLENGHIDFGFKNSKLLSIDRFTKTQYNTSVQITKVIGIY